MRALPGDDLLGRLQLIPSDVKLLLRLDAPGVELDPAVSKRIANTVRLWLENEGPSVSPRLSVHGIDFEIIERDVGYAKVRLVARGPAFVVNPTPLRRKVEAKARKYKRACADAGIPLVVALVADSLADRLGWS